MAVDGKDGLDKALEGDFDLVITDVDMPNMDGFELCSKLKGEQKTSNIPIIILSTRDSDEHVEMVSRRG